MSENLTEAEKTGERTLDEIREMYGNLVLRKLNLWGGYADAVTLLGYIATLEAENAALKERLATQSFKSLVESEGLSPCPFCGSAPRIEHHFSKDEYRYCCCSNPSCPSNSSSLSDEAALAAWNTRYQPQPESAGGRGCLWQGEDFNGCAEPAIVETDFCETHMNSHYARVFKAIADKGSLASAITDADVALVFDSLL